MKFFADTADTDAIRELAEAGLIDGVTTNPSLIHKAGRDFLEVTKEICALVDGPVSAEVVAMDHTGMLREAETLRKIADNVCVMQKGRIVESGTTDEIFANPSQQYTRELLEAIPGAQFEFGR